MQPYFLCFLPMFVAFRAKKISLLYYSKYMVFFYCWDMQYAVTSFLLDSITCLKATHQGEMESFLLYLYFPFIGFLLNQMMAKLDWFYIPFIFLFIFSASLSFLLYYHKAVSALFSVHFIAFKNFGNSFSWSFNLLFLENSMNFLPQPSLLIVVWVMARSAFTYT